MNDDIVDDKKTIKSKKEVEGRLKSKGPVAILFFMRSCGHCIATKPIWDELAKEGIMNMENVSSDNTPDELGISGFPTMIVVKDGKITNSRDENRCFIYLHFMNFKSKNYRHDGSEQPWKSGNTICFASKNDMDKGIVINLEGIFPA
jgi:hypothetical protein